MSNQQNSDIFRTIDSLPALPATVSKVLAVTADPESSVLDLVNAILPDQAMCATILKLANSAFFGMPRGVSTMDKAVTVLGFNEVHNIVLGKAVYNSFRANNSSNLHALETFWDHAFTCGLAAKILAKDLGHSENELFIAGLIHDIGKLALFKARPDDYLQILTLTGTEQIRCKEFELEHIGIDHEEVGYELLTRWLFPVALLCPVGFHHHPQECCGNPSHTLIVQISDILSLLTVDKSTSENSPILPKLLELIPDSQALWQQYNIPVNEELLQSWMAKLYRSTEEDNAILNIFTS